MWRNNNFNENLLQCYPSFEFSSWDLNVYDNYNGKIVEEHILSIHGKIFSNK